MVTINEFLWPALAYLLGSVPFGLIIAKGKGIDLRKHGSGNIGATNVARVIGKTYGLITLTADVAKGLIPVLACRYLGEGLQNPQFILALTALSAVAGHCFSIFLGFRGGKGVATAAGVFLGLCPLALALAAAGFVMVVKMSGYVSLGSLTASALFPVLLYVFCPDPFLEPMAWSITIIIWFRHKDNIKRLMTGQEKSWKKK